MSSSVSNAPPATQRHARAQEGLALVWSPVPGAIRYGFIVGFADMPVPPIEAIMRGAAPGFTVLGIPPRFTGAVDLGSPVGEERQYALIAYRGDGAMAPVAGVQFLPARSAPRDREYHPLIPPALTRPPGWTPPVPTREAAASAPAETAPARPVAPADPWAALESASTSSPSPAPTTPVFPSTPAGTAPAQPADPWAALDAAAREQQAPPVERPAANVSFASPQAAVQPPTSSPPTPVTPATRPVETAPGQHAEPVRQDMAPPVEPPAASLREQAPQEQAPRTVPPSQAQVPAASQAPVAPERREEREERKAGRWGVFQALRQKIVTPIIPPAREDQPQAPISPAVQPEARTPDEPTAVAPAASISMPSTTPATPPASEPVEAVSEHRQEERVEAIPEVQARSDMIAPVERATPPQVGERVTPPEVTEERLVPQEREEVVPEPIARPAAEAAEATITPAEERLDEQTILPEPVAFVEQPPIVAEEPSDAWIAQAEAELAAQWAARSAQEEEQPDVSAEAAPDISAEAAPDIQEGVAPGVVAEVTPGVVAEVTPDVVAEVAPDVPEEMASGVIEGAAPGVHEGATLSTPPGATPDAMSRAEQAAVAEPAEEEEQVEVSASQAATGPSQAPVPDVQTAEPDVPPIPAAAVGEDIAPIVSEAITPIVGEDVSPVGEAPTPSTTEAAPVHAQSIETPAAETVAPIRPIEEVTAPGEDRADLEPPRAAAPVEAEAVATPIPADVEAYTPAVEADVQTTPVEAEALAVPVEAEATDMPEVAASPEEQAERAMAAVPGDVLAARASAVTTTTEAATGYGQREGSEGDEETQAAPIVAEPEFAAASSALDEAMTEPVAGELEAPTLAEPSAPALAESATPTLTEPSASERLPADALAVEAAATPLLTQAAAGPVESTPETVAPSVQDLVDPRADEGIQDTIEPVSEPLVPELAGITETEEAGNAPEGEQAAVAEAASGDALAGQVEPPTDALQVGQAEQEGALSASALLEEIPGELADESREERPVDAVAPVTEEPVAVDAAVESTAMAAPEAEQPVSGNAVGEESAPPLEAAPPVTDVEPSQTDVEAAYEAVAIEAPLELSTLEGDHAEQTAAIEHDATVPSAERTPVAPVQPVPVAPVQPVPVAPAEPTPLVSLAEPTVEPSLQNEAMAREQSEATTGETAEETASELAAPVEPSESGAPPQLAEPAVLTEPLDVVAPAASSWEDTTPVPVSAEAMLIEEETPHVDTAPIEAKLPATETVPAEPEPLIVPVGAEPPAAVAASVEPESSDIAVAVSAEESQPALDAEPAPPAVAAEFAPTLSAATTASTEPEPAVEPEVTPQLALEPEIVPEAAAEPEVETPDAAAPDVMLESVRQPEVVPERAAELEVMPEAVVEPDVEMPAAAIPAVEMPVVAVPEVAPEPDPALAGPAPSPSEAVAMLDEAELYLLPTWLDLAAAARLLAQAARAIPGDPRLLDLQRQLHEAQADDDGEDVEDMLREARAALERRDYWGAVDSYEQALARQADNAEARQGLERARVLARWSAQMSGAGSDAGRLQHIGDDFMEVAPDLAAQSYAAAFAAHPTIVILRGLLLSQARGEQWDDLAESAAHGVETLRQSGRIAADPAQDAALSLLQQQLQVSTALGGVQGAIENLTQALVASAQQGRH